MRPQLIGIAGKARSGKDTAADLILAEVGGYRYSLADPIRRMLKAGLNIDMQDPYWQENKEKPIPAFGDKSPRQMMQWLGTEWGRVLVSDGLWIVLAMQEFLNRGPGMIVPDVRYENEARWVRQHGLLIHITRPGVSPVNSHISENGVSYEVCDRTIFNDGSLEDLLTRVREILREHKAGEPVHLGGAQVPS